MIWISSYLILGNQSKIGKRGVGNLSNFTGQAKFGSIESNPTSIILMAAG